MRKAIIILALLNVMYFSQAQKIVDVKLKHTHKLLPNIPLPKGTNDFKVEFNNPYKYEIGKVVRQSNQKMRLGYEDVFVDETNKLINEYLKIEGLRKSNNPQIVIEFSIGQILDSKLAKQTGDGPNENLTRTYTFKWPIKMIVKTLNGVILLNREIYSSSFELRGTIDEKNTPGFTSKSNIAIREKSLYKSFSLAYSILNDNFGSPTVTENITLYTAKSKKMDYSDIDRANKFFSDALQEKDNNKFFELINSSIETWNSVIEKTDLVNKGARINKNMSDYIKMNLINGYILINRFDEASALVKSLIEDENIKSGIKNEVRKLQNKIIDREKRFKANNI